MSRYNWAFSTANRCKDYFFYNIPDAVSSGTRRPDVHRSDAVVRGADQGPEADDEPQALCKVP